MSVDTLSEPWLRSFRRKITKWYDANYRSLPWRGTVDPYAIWISETMLQQTQVATVLDYYQRFLQRFPDVRALAGADEQEVLHLWAGLGYYRRARQMHAAAKRIIAQFDGQFPTAFNDVLSLPGVGRYTAGAITSFAFDARSPIVEANTVRLYSRLLALQESPQIPTSQKRLWEFASTILPKRRGSGRLNQAVMELGSQICKPTSPDCSSCPLQSLCPTHAQGLEAKIPASKPKKIISPQTHVAVLIRKRGRFLLRRNEPGQWWEGLWDFPRANLSLLQSTRAFDCDNPNSSANLEIAELAMLQTHALSCKSLSYARTIKHSVTRYRISLFCFHAALESRSTSGLDGEWKWVSEATKLPLCAPAERLWQWEIAGS